MFHGEDLDKHTLEDFYQPIPDLCGYIPTSEMTRVVEYGVACAATLAQWILMHKAPLVRIGYSGVSLGEAVSIANDDERFLEVLAEKVTAAAADTVYCCECAEYFLMADGAGKPCEACGSTLERVSFTARDFGDDLIGMADVSVIADALLCHAKKVLEEDSHFFQDKLADFEFYLNELVSVEDPFSFLSWVTWVNNAYHTSGLLMEDYGPDVGVDYELIDRASQGVGGVFGDMSITNEDLEMLRSIAKELQGVIEGLTRD
jgi:hypothetical protein